MQASVDISLYPLAEDYVPAIREFIERVDGYPNITVSRGDLSTQLFGDFDEIMRILTIELRLSWETWGKGVFVIKFLKDNLEGLGRT
ncbi:MAG: YkoF family thiamine/hydroxymethylpyrimidine-binding protein [Gammaproteobacteria bacterium]|nr:YkoF family thiamine/hydroxymethylpyrimidine-binding protein [Gammaproteobacteria bacterium]